MKATYRIIRPTRLALMAPPTKSMDGVNSSGDPLAMPHSSVPVPTHQEKDTSSLVWAERLSHFHSSLSKGLPAAFFCSGMVLMWLVFHSL